MASAFFISSTFRFDAATRELSRVELDGSAMPVPLGSRAADMLLLFLQRPAELVTKGEIMDAVWPDVTVEDSNLPVQIAALRRALGASAITTVPGRGYRFTLPVQEDGKAEFPIPLSTVQHREPRDASAAPADQASGGPSAHRASPQASLWGRLGFATVPKWAPFAAAVLLAAITLGAFFLTRSGERPPVALTPPQLYERGNHFVHSAQYDSAIADFTEIIRLDPWAWRAYLLRAMARRYKGDLDAAVADASKVIELFPAEHRGYIERGNVYLAKGDFDRAVVDFSAAIELVHSSNEAPFGQGLAYFFKHDLSKAQASFQSAHDILPSWDLPVLWLGVVQRRGKLTGGFEAAARKLNPTAWPSPVVSMLLGELSRDRALEAADVKDPATKRVRVCHVNFYGGELALAQNASEEAARLFRLAADGCPSSLLERNGANAELRALAIPH